MRQHTGLAAACAGDDEQGFFRGGNSLALRLVERTKNWCDVHLALCGKGSQGSAV